MFCLYCKYSNTITDDNLNIFFQNVIIQNVNIQRPHQMEGVVRENMVHASRA